jgi:peptidoglycan/xylan/chitin deacetylase (PgdA/CDA1 family)
VLTHGSRERKWVALTFDDGWSADRCAQIARTLRRKRATATFLINGIYMRREPARWRSILEGFPVANHTYAHSDLTLLSRSAIRDQVAGDEARVEAILRRPMLKLLRPPYGAYDGDVVAVSDALGYRLVLWDVDSGDTFSGATTSDVLSRAVRGVRGSIVLMHCGPAATPAAVGRIVASYRARGYTLVDLGRMFGLTTRTRPPTACRVRNGRTGRVHWKLSRAEAAARAGDRLVISGRCRGSTIVRRDLILKGIRITGSGRPTLDGEGEARVLTVQRGLTVVVKDLLIERGRSDEGGGIRNAGLLRLRDVAVRDNRAGRGGGIENRPPGHLRLLGASIVRDNVARIEGGGIRNLGTMAGVVCGAGGNVRSNTPDQCAPHPSPPPDPEPSPLPEPGS